MIGKTISQYRILEKIGAGGMGEVFLAEDTKLERNVALKFLPRHLMADEEARERFQREARSAASLSHPNIVTIHEIGEHEGQVFIAMEFVEGRTLKELISGPVGANDYSPLPITHHPLPITQVIEIAAQIASGLAAAHARGIVHRDIKPQNIVVAPDGRAKILDFGLAKLKGASQLTKESSAYGTVHYMSPEQGLGREVDVRSDIWSLGVVLFEMLAGTPPFLGEYEQAVIYAIINEETPPLPGAVRLECPGLEDVVRRCLAKRSQDRFPSAAGLAQALGALTGTMDAAPPEKTSRKRFFRRTRLVACSLLALAGITGFLTLDRRAGDTVRQLLGLSRLPRARHLAVLPIRVAGGRDTALLADGFATVLIDKLTWLEKFHASLWTVPAGEVFKHRGKSPQFLQRLWGCNLFIAGDLRAEKNHLRLRLMLQDARSGRLLKRIELQGNMANLTLFQNGLCSRIHQLLDLPEPPGAGPYINTGGTSMPGAYILYLKGLGWIQDNDNAASIDRGSSLLERALHQDDSYLQARLALVEALSSKSHLSKDPGWLRLAEDHGRSLKQAAGQWAPAQLAWALLLDKSGKNAEALPALQQVLRLDAHCYRACIKLANACQAESRTGEAEKYYKQAILLRPGYPMAYENLAYFYNLNGRYDEARDLYKKATELAPGDINGFINLGSMYMNKGDRENARMTFEKAIAIQPDAAARSNLATLYFFDGDYRKALPLYSALARETDDFIMWGNLADTFRQLPEHRGKTVSAYQKAISRAGALLVNEVDSQKLSEITSCLAIYYAHLGQKDKALAAIVRARALAPANLEIIRRAILVHEAVGDRSQSLDALREYRERLGGMDEIEREPDLAALRADPSYREMLGGTH